MTTYILSSQFSGCLFKGILNLEKILSWVGEKILIPVCKVIYPSFLRPSYLYYLGLGGITCIYRFIKCYSRYSLGGNLTTSLYCVMFPFEYFFKRTTGLSCNYPAHCVNAFVLLYLMGGFLFLETIDGQTTVPLEN